MRVVDRKTSWGRMVICSRDGSENPVVEVMEFEEAGKFHIHEATEFVKCVGGRGAVEMDLPGGLARHKLPGNDVRIPAGVPHRMVPCGESLICVVTYGQL